MYFKSASNNIAIQKTGSISSIDLDKFCIESECYRRTYYATLPTCWLLLRCIRRCRSGRFLFNITLKLWYKSRLSRPCNCWSLKCSWGIACHRYPNYICIFDLTPGLNHSVETPRTVDPKWNILYWGSKWNLRTVCCGLNHSVETPHTVDPKWNILYWGSKWNLHTVCCGAVGCEWGTTSVYFTITYVCFILSRLPVFTLSVPTSRFLIFVKSIIWRTHTNLQTNSCWFKIWMGFAGQILIRLRTSSIWGCI